MFHRLGRLVTTHPGKVCLAWLAAAVVLSFIAPNWDRTAQDDDIHFLPSRCDSVRGYQLLAQSFPQDIFASRLIFAFERADRPLTEADLARTDRLVGVLENLRDEEPELRIGRVYSRRDAFIGKRLVSDDGRCALIQVSLNTPFLAIQTRDTVERAEARLREHLADFGSDAPRMLVTGPAGVGRDLLRAGAESLDGTTVATVLLVVVILLFVYRAPLLALVPLITIAVSVQVSLHLLAMLTLIPGVHLVNISRIFAIVILYGAGTDYCLFLISRYREELNEGHDGTTSLRRSLAGVGGALAGSAGTVICGLGLMIFAEFARVRCAGPAIALSLAVALVASLTLAPAILSLLGRAVFWPTKDAGLRIAAQPIDKHACTAPSARGWERISHAVVARPLLVWSVAFIGLLPLAVVGLNVTPAYKATGELSPRSDSVLGLQAIQRHFSAGEVGPLTVLLQTDQDWNSPRGREIIHHLTRGFQHLANVEEVRSLTQPLGKATPAAIPVLPAKGLLGSVFKSVETRLGKVLESGQNAARDFYLSRASDNEGVGHVTRLDVVLRSDPFEPASMETLGVIQTWLGSELSHLARNFGSARAECYGVTVNARDLATVTESDRRRINVMVLAGIFLILFVLVRRVWLAGYLLLTVLFSYFATLGATTLASTLWSGRPLGLVDWRVPFFLFVILVAVGEDYNILLIDRLLHERKRHGSVEGTRRALARTGGTISACGLIMAGTFATLMLASLSTLVQIGFALSFGVLLDTFVIRPFLVPAFLMLVWKSSAKRQAEAVEALHASTLKRAG